MSGNAWKLSLPCTRLEADAIAAAEHDIPAVLMTSEVDPDEKGASDEWRLDAYFDGEPTRATVAAVRELAASGGWSRAQPAPLADEDWVTMSQAGLAPIREGRFVVHTAAHPVGDQPGVRAFRIEAGQAFGTGHHATTAGCLAMLDRLAAAGAMVARAIDVGTGTGLLAFAALDLWPDAHAVATDIDAIAVAVTGENADANGVARDRLRLLVADGALDPAIAAGGPYDLVIANILAGPLTSMAPELASIAGPHATIVLAGLLDTQRAGVVAAYAACGCTLAEVDRRGDWTILRLDAGATPFVPDAPFDPKGRDGWALDL
jgi:ribosomal protein L11 methyltransferase